MQVLFDLNAYRLANIVAHYFLIALLGSYGSASEPPDPGPLSPIAGDSPACQRACAALNSHFHESVFFGQSGNFDFFDAKQAELVPACRVEPSSAKDISRVLSIVIDNECHFAIKSGGHERSPGGSNAAGGVTIDLVKLKSIELANDRKSVSLGAGLRWGEVYQALEKEKLLVLGGRVANVGVGGLLLGGGLSFFSNERGLACDSIISYEMVLPNSSIVTVGQDSYPDLYRALRGAGQTNFGIVTSFTLETFYSPHRIWNGERMAVAQKAEDMLRANYEVVTTTMDEDPHVALINSMACISKKKRLFFAQTLAQHTTHNSTEQWPSSLKSHGEMEEHPSMQHMLGTSRPFIDSVTNITGHLALGVPSMERKPRIIYGTLSYRPSVELEIRISEILCEEVETEENIPGFLHSVAMHPLSSRMIANMRKRGGNAVRSLAEHNGPLIILNTLWQWNEKADDDKAHQSHSRFMSRVEVEVQRMGLWHPYKYINYAEATQDVYNGYGDLANLKRLQRDVDPRGVFAKGGLAGGAYKINDDGWRPAKTATTAEAAPPHQDEL